MIQEEELIFLKNHLGTDGKLIISDDLTEDQKTRFEFINGLDIDLASMIENRFSAGNYDDKDEEDDDENSGVASFDNSQVSTVEIQETGEEVNDLDDFF